jgi:hypothetical protein
MFYLIENTTSAPYISQNGVKFVTLETVVVWLHTTLGMTSAHLHFFSPSSIFLIASNIWVLALLGMVYKCEGHLRSYLLTRVLEHCIVKVFCIVNYNVAREVIAADDILPEKLFHSCGAYICYQLRLSPLCEVLHSHNNEGVIFLCWC